MQLNLNKMRSISLICFFIFSCVPAVMAQDTVMHTVGITKWVSNSGYERNIQGFKDALTAAGFVEGQNIQYVIKSAEADFDQQVAQLELMIEKNVDLIYSLTTPGTLAAKSVTKDIPIVFSIVTFPVEAGIVDSLVSSKNNLTGARNYIPAARQYFFFEKIFPGTKTMAFVHRKGESNSVIQYNEFKENLEKRKIEVLDIAAVDLDDMRSQLEFVADKVDSFFAACDTLVQSGGHDVIVEVSKKHKKPSFSCLRDGVLKGALIGDVVSLYELGKISGQKAVLVLNGLKPEQIMIESPDEDYLIVNLTAINALGLSVPQELMDKVKEIER